MNHVVLARREHIPELLRLLTQVNLIHHEGRPDLFKGPATKYDADELARMLDSADHPIYVCLDEEETVLGYAMCQIKETPESALMHAVRSFYIDDLCVDENCRGGGVGRTLFSYVRAAAEKAGCGSITLNVWAFNESAVHFYESLGMKPQRTIMELPLTV